MRCGVATLLEIVESASNIEICLIKGDKTEMIPEEQIEQLVKELKAEKEAAEKKVRYDLKP